MEKISVNKVLFRVSPQKMQPIANLVRKKRLDDALKILSFSNKKGAAILFKMLQGSFKTLYRGNQEEARFFFLISLNVDEGKTLKRTFFRAKGRSDIKRNRFSLISYQIQKTLSLQ